MIDDKVREAVAVFHDERSLQFAADELLTVGFDRSQLSLLASDQVVAEKLGHAYERIFEVEDDPDVPSLAYRGSDSRKEAESAVAGGLAYVGALGTVGAIVASGGTIAAILIGAAIAGGTSGLIGVMLARFIERRHANRIQEQLDHGGLLLWVRTVDAEHENRACTILRRHGAEDVHVHSLPKVHYDLESGVSYDTSFMKRLGL